MSAGDIQPAGMELPRRIERLPGEPEWLWSLDAVQMIGFLEAGDHYQFGYGECGTDPDILAPAALEGIRRDWWLEGFRYYFTSLPIQPCCDAALWLIRRGFDRKSAS